MYYERVMDEEDGIDSVMKDHGFDSKTEVKCPLSVQAAR
jgi:hypothetical protein